MGERYWRPLLIRVNVLDGLLWFCEIEGQPGFVDSNLYRFKGSIEAISDDRDIVLLASAIVGGGCKVRY